MSYNILGLPYIQIPRDVVRLFDGDYALAVVAYEVFQNTSPKSPVWHCTYDEWYARTALTKYRVNNATTKLEELGYITKTVKKVDGVPMNHYSIVNDANGAPKFLMDCIVDFEE